MAISGTIGHAVNYRERAWGYVAILARFAQRKPVGFASMTLIVLIVVAAIFANLISLHDPLSQFGNMAFASPLSISPDGKPYILGGDPLGRDMFARILYGARISLYVGLASVGLGVAVGSVIGLTSGYLGGWLDNGIQRIMDGSMALPPLILALLIASVLGPSTFNTTVAIAIVWVPTTNRVVRGSVLSAKENDYVEAAHAIGCSDLRVAVRHILPNILAPLTVLATLMIAQAILLEASLSFLGVGTPPPTPSWGAMVSGPARDYIAHEPLLLIFPGGALALTVLAFSLAGDTLRDLWDPKLKGI